MHSINQNQILPHLGRLTLGSASIAALGVLFPAIALTLFIAAVSAGVLFIAIADYTASQRRWVPARIGGAAQRKQTLRLAV